MKSVLLSICLLFTATTLALSHSVVTKSSPNDGARLRVAPKHLDVSFSKPTRVVKASLTHNDGDPLKLTLSTKEPTELIRFSPAPTAAGDYIIKWRALSEDGHTLKGSLQFSIIEQN